MLVLTEEIGQPVFDAGGTRVGRAVELAVDAAGPAARVIRVGIGRNGIGRARRVRSWVRWGDVASFEKTAVQLREGAAISTELPESERGELWLVRDVLDTQIIDPEGGRLVRVGDVVLLRVGEELRVVAVEFGAGPVARRLGLRWLGERLTTVSIDWRDLHLASARGLTAQLATNSEHLEAMTPRELAMMIAQVPTERGSVVLDAAGARQAAKALSLAHPDVASRLVHALPHQFVSEILEHMPTDDATETLRLVPTDRVEVLLGNVESGRAAELRALLSHLPDTAGGLMSSEVRVARASESMDEIRAQLGADPPRAGRFGGVFVVDDDHRPVGLLTPGEIIVGAPTGPGPSPIPATTPIDEVIDRFATSDIESVAVVDDAGRLIGAIGVEDVLEELVAERLPGRRRFRSFINRHHTVRDRARAATRRG